MTLPDPLGVESHVVAYLPDLGSVRAEYRVPNLPRDSVLEVGIQARVYGLTEVRSLGALPSSGPIEAGPEVAAEAGSEWRQIDLPLPRLEYDEYAVVAKVHPRDPDYPRDEFVPSHCYVEELTYGLRPVRMRLGDILAVYEGGANPLAEEAIKNQVRVGLVVAEDEDGALYSVHEVDGKPRPTLLPGHGSSR